jgi:type III restriction enzyme
LHREPKSKIFVLQATMRCLRAIGPDQETGLVFLSDENISILNSELQENFRLSVDELTLNSESKEDLEVRLVPPPVKIKLKKVRKLHSLKEKTITNGVDFEFEKADIEKYKIFRSERSINDLSKKLGADSDVTYIKEKRDFSEITLVSEVSRYLNKSPLQIKQILSFSKQDIPKILKEVNEFNELLYDWIIPKLFNLFYDIIEYESKEDFEIELVKEPKEGFYRVKADKALVASINDEAFSCFKDKSFHLDYYCFDSLPENKIFNTLLNDGTVRKVWFTGMLTHGQSDFLIPYIDHDSHTLRSYFPDFLIQLTDGNYIILEVKGDNMIDDAVVRSKQEYASQLASASQMTYRLVASSTIMNNSFRL